MKRVKIVVLRKKTMYFLSSTVLVFLLFSVSLCIYLSSLFNTFTDPKSGIIIVDPGHGGIDGGTNKDEFREQLSKAIADGVEHYLKTSEEVLLPKG